MLPERIRTSDVQSRLDPRAPHLALHLLSQVTTSARRFLMPYHPLLPDAVLESFFSERLVKVRSHAIVVTSFPLTLRSDSIYLVRLSLHSATCRFTGPGSRMRVHLRQHTIRRELWPVD